MELRCWGGSLGWTIVANTLSEKKRMKRHNGRIERPVVYAELFRGESVLVVILANFPTMRKELQILVGVMKRIEVPGWVMTNLMVSKRVVQVLAIEEILNLMRKRKVTEKRVMEMLRMAALKKEKEWKGRIGSEGLEMLMIGGNKRDQDGLMIRNLEVTILKMII